MQLQDYLSRCIFRVEAGDRAGSGFFVAPGLIVTSARLVEDPESGDFPLSEVSVRRNGSREAARVVRYAASPDPDLAVLEVAGAVPAVVCMYAPRRAGDTLYVCGATGANAHPTSISVDAPAQEGHVLRFETPLPAGLEGAPVLNLRTGGVCAVVTRGTMSSTGSVRIPPCGAATSVSVIARLFPDVYARHDRYHRESPGWFAATGVRGTIFAAREHILATRDTCETPIQPLITPRNGRGPIDLLAPVAFQPPFHRISPRQAGLQTSIDDVLERSRAAGRSVLLIGPTGSGRSSVLRALGYRTASAFGNLGTLDQDCAFPILLRANQLATDAGSVEETILASMEKGNEVMTGIDFPPTFLTDVARSPGVRLLLMIDGMDEIQNARDIAELVGLIGRIQEDPGFGVRTQLLVTARPSAAEHFRYSRFDVCEIQPLGEASIRLAAERWLGGESGAFLTANEKLVASGSLSSPLVLAVALKLYETGPRPLPAQVVELYGTLISNLALERRDELAAKYGSEVADNAVELLGFVALELLRSATVMDEAWVRLTARRYFEQYLKLDSRRAGAGAESFTHFAAADSHFIGPAGSRFFWSHLSFRDYFAAACLVKLHTADGGAVDEIRRRWFDANWGRAPSFALQLLGDEAARLDLIREVMSSGRDARFTFTTELVREGAQLPPEMIRQFVSALAGKVRAEREQGPDGDAGPVTFDLLLSLSHVPEAKAALGELALGARSS